MVIVIGPKLTKSLGFFLHSDRPSLSPLLSSPLTSLLTQWPILSNYCLPSFYFDASTSLRLPTWHPIIFNFIYRNCQAKVFTHNIQEYPRSLRIKWSCKCDPKTLDNWRCSGMLYCEAGGAVMCSQRCRPYWIILCEWVGTVRLVFQRVPAAHAALSKVLSTKMQSVSEKHAWAHSLESPRTLHFHFDSPWFNVPQLKPTTLKGNQCNRFLGSPLFRSPLWFPLARTSSALVIN